MPCLEFVTSDIGESSFHVRTYWRTEEGSIVPEGSIPEDTEETR